MPPSPSPVVTHVPLPVNGDGSQVAERALGLMKDRTLGAGRACAETCGTGPVLDDWLRSRPPRATR